MKRFISILICISLTITLCSCGRGLKRFEKSFLDVFDTASTVVAYDENAAQFEERYEALHKRLAYYNKLFDIYHSYSGITSLKDVNEKAALSPVRVDKTTLALLLYGKEVYALTDGAVNICMGSVLSIWHEYREEGKQLPPADKLKKAAAHCNMNDLIIDEKNGTVYFADSEMKLDVGAVAKGFAAQRAKEYAQQNLWDAALINLGGNVVTFGTKPDGSKWNVQIENPNPKSSEALQTLAVTDTAVVTSGDYQRYYEVDGKRYCHIIDPQTLMPAQRYSSVSVVYDDAARADALSTALFIMSEEAGRKLLSKYPDIKVYWVNKDYRVTHN